MIKKVLFTSIIFFYILPGFLVFLPRPYVEDIHRCHLIPNLSFIFASKGYIIFSVLSVLATLFSSFKLYTILKRHLDYKKILDCCEYRSVSGNLCKVLDIETPYAFSFGYFRKKIIVTKGLLNVLSEEEIKAVILHEKGHLEKNHNVKKLIYYLFMSPFMFLSFVKKFYKEIIVDMELEADRYAFSSGANPCSLANAILNVTNKGLDLHTSYLGEMERIESLFSENYYFKNNLSIKNVLCFLLPWFFLLVSFLSSMNACIVNKNLMNKNFVKKRLISP